MATQLRNALFVSVSLLAVLGTTTFAEAACYVKDNGQRKLLGRFPFKYAYRDCIRVYENHYLREYNDGESDLYLKCSTGEQLIASVRDYEIFYTGQKVAGCFIPETLG